MNNNKSKTNADLIAFIRTQIAESKITIAEEINNDLEEAYLTGKYAAFERVLEYINNKNNV